MPILKLEEIMNQTLPTAGTLLRERGGAWLARMRLWIQANEIPPSNKQNPNQPIELKPCTNSDLEALAASIAESAIIEAFADICQLTGDLKPSGLSLKKALGGKSFIITPVHKHENGSLNHDWCCSAYSWAIGKMTCGQGEFSSLGHWSNPCPSCSRDNDTETE